MATPTCRSIVRQIVAYASNRWHAGRAHRYAAVPQDVQEDRSLQLMDSKMEKGDAQIDKGHPKGVKILENGVHDTRTEQVQLSPLSPLHKESSGYESISPCEGEPLDEDFYGASITSLLRDMHELSCGPKTTSCCLPLCRIIFTVTMFFLTTAVLLAMFLVAEADVMVTPDRVENMRRVYSSYEGWMYGNHTYLTVNGFDRGRHGYFQPHMFDSLPGDLKKTICGIPLAHTDFTAAVLAVWSFTVLIDLRQVLRLFTLLICKVHTVSSAQDIFADSQGNPVSELTLSSGCFVLEGLTVMFKIVLAMVIFLPRCLLDMCLLYLGSRWLLATEGLANLVLNAIALELILSLKDFFYSAVIPSSTIKATKDMIIRQRSREQPSCASYLRSLSWLLVVAAWVFVYMNFIQGVLPDFNWDVYKVCHKGQNNHPWPLSNLSHVVGYHWPFSNFTMPKMAINGRNLWMEGHHWPLWMEGHHSPFSNFTMPKMAINGRNLWKTA